MKKLYWFLRIFFKVLGKVATIDGKRVSAFHYAKDCVDTVYGVS